MTLLELRRRNQREAMLRLRMGRGVTKLLALGPRPFLELLTELAAEHDIILEDVADRLEDYAAMSPELVMAVGADRLEQCRPRLVATR